MSNQKGEVWNNGMTKRATVKVERVHCNMITFLIKKNPNSFHLFEVVKSRENDVMSSSDETHGSQQLQHEGFGPVAAEEV